MCYAIVMLLLCDVVKDQEENDPIGRTVLKKTSEKPTSIVCMMHDYSRQRRTIGSFSATADRLLVTNAIS